MAQDIMTSEEAAAYLRVGVDTLKRKARAGEVPAAKVGRRWRFRRAELDAWLGRGGDRYDLRVDEGLAAVVAERVADGGEEAGQPLEEFLQERGL
jgi:excisionase family DNA binding protein